MLAVCECERKQSASQPAAAYTAGLVAGAMEGAVRRRARPRLRALCGSVPVAVASSSDTQATHAYLIAQYKLATALLHETAAARGAESAAAAQIARGCPGVVSGMPQEPSLRPFPAPLPRVRGENARFSEQKQTIEEELGAAVDRESLYLPAEEAFAAEVRQLSWSNPAIAAARSRDHVEAASRLRPRSTVLRRREGVDPERLSRPVGDQPGIRGFTSGTEELRAGRTFAGHAAEALREHSGSSADPQDQRLENKLLASAGAAVRTVFSLDRIVGFPRAGTEEPKPIAVGHESTAAGTSFQVSSESGGLFDGRGCHRSASVYYSRPGAPEVLIQGGLNNPICLSPPQYRHPALFCEVGIETIQTAVPASVRSVRLTLANGRTIGSRVVRVSRRDGGPAGIYAQEIRGSTSHAMSLVELNAGGSIVLTVNCRDTAVSNDAMHRRDSRRAQNSPAGAPQEENPSRSALSAVSTASLSSASDTGVDPELGEPAIGPGASKAFRWSLSIGCTPHPYAILYGILAPPGKSVVAQTPQGADALNVVPVEPRMHANGPLVYECSARCPLN